MSVHAPTFVPEAPQAQKSRPNSTSASPNRTGAKYLQNNELMRLNIAQMYQYYNQLIIKQGSDQRYKPQATKHNPFTNLERPPVPFMPMPPKDRSASRDRSAEERRNLLTSIDEPILKMQVPQVPNLRRFSNDPPQGPARPKQLNPEIKHRYSTKEIL